MTSSDNPAAVDARSDSVALSFFGATGTVTGSRYLLECAGSRLLVDCGLFQGARALRERNWEDLPFRLANSDEVLLTHAHLDHSGGLPCLVSRGWKGRIICTAPTFDLCRLLLPDSGFLQEKDAEYANRRGFSRHIPALPLYTQEDAYRALEQFTAVTTNQDVELAADLHARFYPGGHILGAASLRIATPNRTIVFSGDLGRYDDRVMRAPQCPHQADYVVIESTYGNRRHEAVDPEDALLSLIEPCLRRGGTVIIPAFAVGRAQALLYYLSRLRAARRLGPVPVYLDSPMAIDASHIFCDHLDQHRLTPDECRAACGVAHYVQDVEESKRLTRDAMPKIIISASGMATGGRVLHHLASYADDPGNLILFSGFQAAGTRGAQMLAGVKTISIHGNHVPVRAQVANLPMLSAHADSDELLRWLSEFKAKPRKVFITHGEPDASAALASRIGQELGWDCYIPVQGEKVQL